MSNSHVSPQDHAAPQQDQTQVKQQKSKKSATAFRTISEVADELDVQQHVLRFWETKFSQVRPLKRGGGRRYYRPEDVELLRRIHHLLYTEGYTIKGVQKLLKGQGKAQILAQKEAAEQPKVIATVPPAIQAEQKAEPAAQANMNDRQKLLLEGMLEDLKSMRALLD